MSERYKEVNNSFQEMASVFSKGLAQSFSNADDALTSRARKLETLGTRLCQAEARQGSSMEELEDLRRTMTGGYEDVKKQREDNIRALYISMVSRFHMTIDEP